MGKRIIALICLFAMLLGFVPSTATTANAATGQYKVGYSKKSINPFVTNDVTGEGVPAKYTDENGDLQDYTDKDANLVYVDIHTGTDSETTAEVPFIAIPLQGYGNTDTRHANFMTDDNGDGLINEDDGLFVTATYVTDSNGNAVVYLSCDMLTGHSELLRQVRTRVVNAVKAADPNSRLQPNQIIMSASHTHSGPYPNDLNAAYATWAESCSYNPGSRTPDTLYAAYWEYMVSQMTAAAVAAYDDRSVAEMSKGSIDASDAMGSMGYTYDGSKDEEKGFLMNSVRNYKVEVEESTWWGTTEYYHYWNGSNGDLLSEENDGWFSSTDVTLEHDHEAEDTLQILKFDRGDAKNPVVLIDWRAHPTGNARINGLNVSSDYINALRYYLEQRNYCVGFWQGTGGNITGSSQISEEYTFGATPDKSVGYPSVELDMIKIPRKASATGFYKEYYTSLGSYYSDGFYRSALYGYLLGMIAEKCLTEKMSGTLDMSDIRVITVNHRLEEQKYSEEWATAATKWKAAVDAGESISYPWDTTVNGTVYVINSSYHAESLYSRTQGDSTWGEQTSGVSLNAILMGKNVALVTGSGELFDFYDADGSTDPEDNDWLELVSDATYGTPFIISNTNANTGYMPNAKAYGYRTLSNSKHPDDAANVANSGSYEVNISRFERGSGEDVVQIYKEMLKIAAAEDGFQVKYCQHCKKDVVWTPVYNEMRNTNYTTGHYYLAEDIIGDGADSTNEIGVSMSAQYYLYQKLHQQTVCLDLRGNVLYNPHVSFTVRRFSTLNIMDTVGGGVVESCTAGIGTQGGTYRTESDCTINLYSGTHKVRSNPDAVNPTGWGGVVFLRGTLNIYEGARVDGADMSDYIYDSTTYDGCGAAIFANSGRVNVLGGTVTNGSVSEAACAPGIFARTNKVVVQVSGKAHVEDIYYNDYVADDGTQNSTRLVVDGDYTGKLGLTIDAQVANYNIIGKLNDNSSVANARITVTNDNVVGLFTRSSDPQILRLRVPTEGTHVATATVGGITTVHTSLADAVTKSGNGFVTLLADVTVTDPLTSNATIDLAGHSITGTLTTADGCKIKLMDSATDDFDCSDGYGKVKITDDNRDKIAALTMDDNLTEDNYLMIIDGEDASFHRVKLQISSMSLRPSVSGLYYSSIFAGDQMVKELIDANGNDEVDFGVALSISAIPDANNLDTKCLYSKFTGFQAGAGANDGASTSTLLYDIITSDRPNILNKAYADMKICGRAFVVLPDGQYVFGKTVERSLCQQTEAVDATWYRLTDDQKNELLDMYQTFGAGETCTFMSKWNVRRIKNNCQ